MVTKLRSGQGKRDDADDDQSNPYMSPSQATQKRSTNSSCLLFVASCSVYFVMCTRCVYFVWVMLS